jgi:hypothetical protein
LNEVLCRLPDNPKKAEKTGQSEQHCNNGSSADLKRGLHAK